MRGLLLSLVVWCGLLVAASASDCKNAQNCSACIQTPNCNWCGKSGEFVTADQSLVRCVERAGSSLDEWTAVCGKENIYSPENYYELITDDELAVAGVIAGSGAASSGSYYSSSSSSSSSRHESLVQMRPQQIGLKLRVRESQSLKVTFRQSEDYPVDLYYLMDLSKSMEDDKDSLSALGATLAEEMQKITRNFRLGFGSFVDKVVMPYVSTVPDKLVAPCDGCARPYGFRNALRLNENASLFVDQVRGAPVSGNLDGPEGGFDAIMQAIKCHDAIGWRGNARHLLLFSTDAGFHYAGDGKLGGIVKPNDGVCHLDKDGMYTHSTLLDYPSVSQINQVAKEDNINIIFAVTSDQASVYTRLAQMIEGSSTGQLTANSSNIVDLVKEEYLKITSKVELKDNATAPVHIRYFSRCKGGPEVETPVCDNLRVGDQVEFRAEVTLESCPSDPTLWRQLIRISPVALADELLLELEMLCDCACERPGHLGYQPSSPECDYHGTYQCGVCSCDPGYLGRRCECGSETTVVAGDVDDSLCQQPNDTKICSGQGSCNCGLCTCNERENPEEVVSGKFCHCTNFLCDRHNGELCSGPSKGVCECSKCVCRKGWKGDDCRCQDSKELCINTETNEECSGNGVCHCNKCKCREADGGARYSGKWCEDCPTCAGKCVLYRWCVQCQVFNTGELDEEGCLANCTLFNSTRVDVATEGEGERTCSFFDENDCRFTFVYGYDENREPVVRVQQTLECPPKLDILGIVLGVILAIVFVGLALLVMWKILTTIHDRREYAQFEKERMMAKWDTGENPIYKQATSTFKNPLYGGK